MSEADCIEDHCARVVLGWWLGTGPGLVSRRAGPKVRRKGNFYEVRIALPTRNAIICMVRAEDVLVTRGGR
jgi:hypothetical protein